MYKIIFYTTRSGKTPLLEYLRELRKAAKTSKDARINLDKITGHIQALSEHGTRLGEPFVKHLGNKIWELRPLRSRILFFFYRDENGFVLLHHFIKKTRKIPPSEIRQAERNMREYLDNAQGGKRDEHHN